MFNLRKYSALEAVPSEMDGSTDTLVDQTAEQAKAGNKPENVPPEPETVDQMTKDLKPTQKTLAQDLLAHQLYEDTLAQLEDMKNRYNIDLSASLTTIPEWQQVVNAVEGTPRNAVEEQAEVAGVKGIENSLMNAADFDALQRRINGNLQQAIRNIQRTQRSNPEPQRVQGVRAFNLQRYKIAQTEVAADELGAKELEFFSMFLPMLLSQDFNEFKYAVETLQDSVALDAQHEVGDALKSLRQTPEEEKEAKAESILRMITKNNWLSPEAMEQILSDSEMLAMSEKVPGIIKFNLSEHVLNNKEAQNSKMVKTAADQFGQHYVLYGPTEKRICPKLAGKAGGYSGTGGVVSEYICRHHCLDGIVIDDHKTICGEALWRANAMEKESREYVNEDGVPQGGLIHKRFQVDRNVPEETRMRLKPGETRKDRPVEVFGNMEARMQAMRKKEGKDRDYRPETNTGDVFDWTKDVDQNNVEQTQKERDRRETAMGHQTVNYTKKDQQENNPKLPKKAFNLRQFKTADPGALPPLSNDSSPVKVEDKKRRTTRKQLAEEIQDTHANKNRKQLAEEISEGHRNKEDKKEKWIQDAVKPKNEGKTTEECGGEVTDSCLDRLEDRGGVWEDRAQFARRMREMKHMKKKKGFNLKDHKTAESKKKS